MIVALQGPLLVFAHEEEHCQQVVDVKDCWEKTKGKNEQNKNHEDKTLDGWAETMTETQTKRGKGYLRKET